MGGQHLVSTESARTSCRRCGVDLLVALSEGLPARVYAVPLDPAAEPRVLAAGLRTYTRTRAGYLDQRDQWNSRSALRPGCTIHAEHRCATGVRR